ncbi:MAG: NBR1-Ig-like domain-containing protein, partial [Anaerolineales bacterium]|nr:NBR1-Ig-like domain-containing protein [Anaerolineales bacterium]
VAAYLTQAVVKDDPTAAPTQVPATPTPTVAEPTPTPEPTFTPLPTFTPGPTATPTATPLPCNWAEFQGDVTVLAGDLFDRGSRITKTWRLKNIGSCIWTKDYALVFVSGERMSARDTVSLPREVPPGGTIDLSVELTAPAKAGTYRGYWQLRSANGARFGIGNDARGTFWVDVRVRQVHRLYTNLALDACRAEWASAAGPLSCPGTQGDPNGYVLLLDRPQLENRAEDEPGILAHPNLADDGWILAAYPLTEIKEGDRFKAWVGCAAGSHGCKVLFRLDYQTRNGKVRPLGDWREGFNGEITKIDLDLSGLAGRNVQLLLSVHVTGKDRNPEMANAIWFMPAIWRLEG